jgi:hypothetical protein
MLKLKRFEEAIRHPYPNAEGVYLKIRPLSPIKMRELRIASKTGKVAVMRPDLGEWQVVDDFDDLRFERKIFAYSLEDWEGISFEDGAKTEKEDLLKAMFEDRDIREFVFRKAFENMELEKAKLEEELKNSESSQGGSQKDKKAGFGVPSVRRPGKPSVGTLE